MSLSVTVSGDSRRFRFDWERAAAGEWIPRASISPLLRLVDGRSFVVDGEAGEIGGPAVSRTGRSSPDADADAADRLLARRSASLLRVADPRLRRSRAYGLLARNGFDSTVAAEAVTRAMGAGGMLAAGAGTGSGIGWDDAQAEDPEADPLDG